MSRIATVSVSDPVQCDILRWPDLTDAEREEFSWLDDEPSQAEAKFCRFDGTLVMFSDWDVAPAPLARLGGWERYEQSNFRVGTVLRTIDDNTVELATYAT